MSDNKTLSCPRCKNKTKELIPVDTSMKLALENSPDLKSLQQLCTKCYLEMGQIASHSARILIEEKFKEHSKRTKWKNRVVILKKARQSMGSGSLIEAASLYEEYLKSLALGFEKPLEEITPAFFKPSRLKKELLVVTYVFWDLLQIYDSNPKYYERQRFVAKKLSEFARENSQMQASLSKKLHSYLPYGKNKALLKDLARDIDKNLVRCFIATASFESPHAQEVRILCAFRDTVLSKSSLGRLFIKFYYTASPFLAKGLDRSTFLKKISKFILTRIAFFLKNAYRLLP